jgi:hypothetical protein
MKKLLESLIWGIIFCIGTIGVAVATFIHPFLGIIAFIIMAIVLSDDASYSDPFDDEI